MKKYMLCIDTMRKHFILVNGSFSRTIEYPSNITTPFRTFASQGSYSGTSFIKCHYKEFENIVPASFVPVTDRRSFEYRTCKNKSMSNKYYQIILLLTIS